MLERRIALGGFSMSFGWLTHACDWISMMARSEDGSKVIFGHMHSTLFPALSIRLSVGLSVHPSHIYFLGMGEVFCLTAPSLTPK